MKAATILPRLRSLREPLIDARLDEVDDAIGEHLRVDAEVLLVGEGRADGGGDRSDPELDRRAVGDQVGHEAADPPLDLADRAGCVLVRRDVALDGEVDVVDMDEAVAEGARHRPVELHDHRLRRPDRGVHRLDARPERAEAMGIRRRGIHEHGIERQSARLSNRRGTSDRKTGT